MNHAFKIKTAQQQQKQKQALALYPKNVDFNFNSLRLNEFFISSLTELKILGPWNRRENFHTFVLQEGRQKKILYPVFLCVPWS